jgi:hypothetical protein
MVFREKGAPKGFWEVAEGRAKLASFWREEQLFFREEEVVVRFSKARERWRAMCEGEMEVL